MAYRAVEKSAETAHKHLTALREVVAKHAEKALIDHPEHRVVIDYTNWKGNRRERVITPVRVFFGSNGYHPAAQWLLEAFDWADSTHKTFAMKDIHKWSQLDG